LLCFFIGKEKSAGGLLWMRWEWSGRAPSANDARLRFQDSLFYHSYFDNLQVTAHQMSGQSHQRDKWWFNGLSKARRGSCAGAGWLIGSCKHVLSRAISANIQNLPSWLEENCVKLVQSGEYGNSARPMFTDRIHNLICDKEKSIPVLFPA
jgi:hypothetical protein